MGSILLSGLRDQNLGENGAQGSKWRKENRDQWAPDIPCYDPVLYSAKFQEASEHAYFVKNSNR